MTKIAGKKPYKMVSLFAGIGGFELAFRSIGVETTLMCEIDAVAKHVLSTNIPNVPIVEDVCTLDSIPNDTDILCAGFPCQDLSSVGGKKGLAGTRSSLVKEVFRILRSQKTEWVVFENVSFMLSLNNGEAIHTIVEELEELGYNWAYRTLDSISFVPQHRCRVFVIASLHYDPRNVILSDEIKEDIGKVSYTDFKKPIGFYWTEGKYALGMINDGIPTLKAGSTIGIPSPPAIVFPNGEVSMPDIRDAERLQGFPPDWTLPAQDISKPSIRWRLVGNAVTVDTVAWIARKIICPKVYDYQKDKPLTFTEKKRNWPKAAWGINGKRFESTVSKFVQDRAAKSLTEFLLFPRKQLSLKATTGFEKRLQNGRMNCPQYFKEAIHQHKLLMEQEHD